VDQQHDTEPIVVGRGLALLRLPFLSSFFFPPFSSLFFFPFAEEPEDRRDRSAQADQSEISLTSMLPRGLSFPPVLFFSSLRASSFDTTSSLPWSSTASPNQQCSVLPIFSLSPLLFSLSSGDFCIRATRKMRNRTKAGGKPGGEQLSGLVPGSPPFPSPSANWG